MSGESDLHDDPRQCVAASALAASGRWVAAMTAAWLAGRPLAKHPGTTLGLR